MTITRFVSAAVIASTLIASLPKVVWAKEEASALIPVDLRAAVDRAAAQFVTESREFSTVLPTSRPAANAKQNANGGGGGGKGMMIWTVVGTVSSVAATYFVMKEVKKQTDTALKQAQQ